MILAGLLLEDRRLVRVKMERMFGLCLALSLLANLGYGQRANPQTDEVLKARILQILNSLEQDTYYGPLPQAALR